VSALLTSRILTVAGFAMTCSFCNRSKKEGGTVRRPFQRGLMRQNRARVNIG
jgi:hypothetical protein